MSSAVGFLLIQPHVSKQWRTESNATPDPEIFANDLEDQTR
jgi:hypothetical protein